MKHRLPLLLNTALAVALVSLLVGASTLTGAPLPEDAFQYNILDVHDTQPGQKPVIRYSVTAPTNGNAPYDIKAAGGPFTTPPGRLGIQIGWSTSEYTNAGSGSHLSPVGPTPASPISINAVTASTANGDGTYTVISSKPIPLSATGSGAVAIEGGPAVGGVRLPVKSVIQYFAITDAAPVARRTVVDINKCKACHQPHLSLHGGNRTDEPRVCVMCHNPNQTDIAYRTSGDEVPVNFPFMVHAIHSYGEKRKTPLTVIGFQGSVNTFAFKFPGVLSNCLTCHVDTTFELPLGPNVLGTTLKTGSTYATATTPKVVDGDFMNDVKMTPTAAVCSGCHDSAEVRKHMQRNGASFATTQAKIWSGQVREKCAGCHGPGKKKDVRRVHEIRHDGEHDD